MFWSKMDGDSCEGTGISEDKEGVRDARNGVDGVRCGIPLETGGSVWVGTRTALRTPQKPTHF